MTKHKLVELNITDFTKCCWRAIRRQQRHTCAARSREEMSRYWNMCCRQSTPACSDWKWLLLWKNINRIDWRDTLDEGETADTVDDSEEDDTTAISSDVSLSGTSELLSSSTSITSVLVHRLVSSATSITSVLVRLVEHDVEIAEETCEQLTDVELRDWVAEETATETMLPTTVGFVLEIAKHLKSPAAEE